eukprot:3924464-Amphidinium_carterae.1
MDTDTESLAINAASMGSGLKTLWQAEEEPWPESYDPVDDDEDYDYLDEDYDQGQDSECEEVYWFAPETLQQPLEEQMLDWTFASFAEVQRQKQWFKKRRGFEDKGKGKGKRKDKGKDYSGYPSSYLPKGKGKSSWRGENFQRFQHRRPSVMIDEHRRVLYGQQEIKSFRE